MTAQLDNKKLVTTLFDLLRDGKVDDAFALLAEDAVWSAATKSIFSESNTVDEAKASMHQMVDASVDGSVRIEPTLMIAEGDYVVVQAEPRVHFKKGTHYNNKNCLVFTIKGGRILKVEEYLDTLYASEALKGVV